MPAALPLPAPTAEPGAVRPPAAARGGLAAALRGLAAALALAAAGGAGAAPAGAVPGGAPGALATPASAAQAPGASAARSRPAPRAAAAPVPAPAGRGPGAGASPTGASPTGASPTGATPTVATATGATATATATAPTYATRIPPPARIAYRLSRGGIVGNGEIDWQPQDDAYTLRLEGRVPLLGTLIVQTSRGGFDAAGLAPQHYTDKRLRRPERRADFDRTAGRVAFSDDDEPPVPLVPGLQDRLSVMLQLAAIANGWRRPPPAGTLLRIPVVGARGGAALWSLRFAGPQSVETPDGAVPALRFLREPERPQDTRAEFWLDPARSYMPVRARLTDGHGDALELLRVTGTP